MNMIKVKVREFAFMKNNKKDELYAHPLKNLIINNSYGNINI